MSQLAIPREETLPRLTLVSPFLPLGIPWNPLEYLVAEDSSTEAPHVGGVVAHLAQHPVLAHAGLIGFTAGQLAHHDGHAVHVAGHAQGPNGTGDG